MPLIKRSNLGRRTRNATCARRRRAKALIAATPVPMEFQEAVASTSATRIAASETPVQAAAAREARNMPSDPKRKKPNNQTGQPRVRNILTLEERVRAIEAYDRKPMYTKVASMFNCSWEQIKNIIQNREEIMAFYENTRPNDPAPVDPEYEIIRNRKVDFLNTCVYEYIQRAQFYMQAVVTEELIRSKACEFRDLMEMGDFTPNKGWLNHFKNIYNISLSQRQIVLHRTPQASMDLKDIMTYCSWNQSKAENEAKAAEAAANEPNTTNEAAPKKLNEKQRRQRKFAFMERALCEYMRRARKFRNFMTNENLVKVALELGEMLKVEGFTPDLNWLLDFRNRYAQSLEQRSGAASLDLRDILSYCGRNVSNVDLISTTADMAASTKTENAELEQDDEVVLVKVEKEQELLTRTPTEESPTRETQPTNALLKVRAVASINTLDWETLAAAHSPGHWSEQSHKSEDEQESLPRQVHCFEDALKLIKPLEEFAMLQENYRAIGLLSQLEDILKRPPSPAVSDHEESY